MRISKMIKKLLGDNTTAYINCKLNTRFNKYEPISVAEINSDNDIIDYTCL